MAHLTVQLGAALVVPIGTLSRKSTDTSGWKARSLREASAVEAGLSAQFGPQHRRRLHRFLAPVAVTGRTGLKSREV